MPARYFSIPFENHAALVEVQKYLQTIYKTGAEWQDPATFHLTLAYVPDAGESDLTAIPVPTNLPVFGVRSDFFRIFENTESGKVPITARIENTPQLVYLQAALAYELLALGLELSPYSYPGLYQPHITLGYLSSLPDTYTEMPGTLALNVDRFVLQGDGYETLKEFSLVAMRAAVAVSEMQKVFGEWVLGEFTANHPTVPTFTDVNVTELTQGDDDPLFVTLPIAQENVVSRNNRFYSAEFVKALERMIRELKPTANQGHIKDEEIGTAFPAPVGYWIGALKSGSVLWGKAYVPPGETREMLRRRKAQNGQAATSIHGIGDAVWDADRGAWSMSAQEFQLFSIDFAPAERAGIPALARVPGITSEMVEVEKESIMDKTQIISELTAADASALPVVVREAILSTHPAARVVSELQGLVGEGKDVVAEFKAMRALLDQQAKQQVETALVTEIAKQVIPNAPADNKSAAAVRQVVLSIVSRPADVAGVEGAVKTVLEMDHIKTLIANTVVSEMGTQRRSQEKPNGATANTEEDAFFEYPAAQE